MQSLLRKMVKSKIAQLARDFSLRHSPSVKQTNTYEDAVCALNKLQSNEMTIQKSLLDRTNPIKNVQKMPLFLEATGIKVEELDALNVIHVAGTKGKGSTCAFAESILRSHGFKTGLYTSPHLVAVRERIRLNGIPLSKEKFATYFWQVYTTLKNQETVDHVKMPAYFMFLTIMAFKVFIQEKVDVVVLEVGVGGEYDCTNIVRSPRVIGITSLGLDHTRLLGTTIREIAWQKAGIMKKGVPAFTVPQPEGGLQTLLERATEKECRLQLAPPLLAYDWDIERCKLGIPGEPQEQNASLALQLCRTWLHAAANVAREPDLQRLFVEDDCFLSIATPFLIPQPTAKGLAMCHWPGRCQTVQVAKGLTYFLDGAHTLESLQCCLRWFREASASEEVGGREVRQVLFFNCIGDRRPEMLLSLLVDHPFHFALFSPNKLSLTKSPYSDQSDFTVGENTEVSRCRANLRIWCHLLSSLQEEENEGRHENSCLLFPCIQDAMHWLQELDTRETHYQVLVTGSLHLVGGVMTHINPHLAL
uniref:Folylpolyglutamate synthase n=1 Tax=Ornithodoros turicata TaxID=34597 RepID=A0A2R5LDA6_9ACAR